MKITLSYRLSYLFLLRCTHKVSRVDLWKLFSFLTCFCWLSGFCCFDDRMSLMRSDIKALENVKLIFMTKLEFCHLVPSCVGLSSGRICNDPSGHEPCPNGFMKKRASKILYLMICGLWNYSGLAVGHAGFYRLQRSQVPTYGCGRHSARSANCSLKIIFQFFPDGAFRGSSGNLLAAQPTLGKCKASLSIYNGFVVKKYFLI